jgi:hypothetical protein
MNLIQAVFSNQYAELKKSDGNTDKGRMNGIIMITVIFFIFLMSVFTLITALARNTAIAKDIRKINTLFGTGWFETKMPGLIGIAILFAIVYGFFGKKAFYDETVKMYNALDEDKQLKVKRKGNRAMHAAVFVFMVSLFISLISLGG